jgi:hypothetical protein
MYYFRVVITDVNDNSTTITHVLGESEEEVRNGYSSLRHHTLEITDVSLASVESHDMIENFSHRHEFPPYIFPEQD